MLRTASVTLILAAGLGMAGLAHADADIYRWKDAQGIYHYSDQWVPGSELIKSSGRQRPPVDNSGPTSDTPPPTSSSDASPPESTATVQSVKQDMAKIRDQQCKEAKDAYDKALHARRITKDGKDGQKEYLTDAEADAYRIRVRGDVDRFCGTAPAAQ